MKKITLKLIPILFIAIFISGVAKAETYTNIKMLRPNGSGQYSQPIYTVTFQTDKPSYNKGEIVKPYLSYSSVSIPSTVITDATNMSLLHDDKNGAYEFVVPLLKNFEVPMNISPDTYFLIAQISPRFSGETGGIGLAQKDSKFNLIGLLGDMFMPKKAEACWASIKTCDDLGQNCTVDIVPTCNFGSGGSSGGSGGGGVLTYVGTTFTVNDSTPKIFVR